MLRCALRCASGLLCLIAAVAATGGPVYVPGDLEPWRAWVLQDQDFRKCPLLSSAGANPGRESFRCAWPERLTLSLDAHGGTFSQRWQVSADSWIQIPGDPEHWPADVRVNGSAGQVVARENSPQLHLQAGEYLLTGAFRFVTRPEQLAVDTRTALVDLTIDGRPIAQPERPGGAVWLGNRRTTQQPQRMLIQVYRLVHDEVPVGLETLIRLRVSGDGREEWLGRALPQEFTPLGLKSELPARLEPDGRLRVQVRAGTWDITLLARGPSVASELRRPAAEQPWPEEEVWSFSGNDQLRVAAAEGPAGVDPAQASVPNDWQEYPAFRMTRESVLKVVERTRGLQNADDNDLQLDRKLWLDFEGRGWTAVDHISGTMRRDWRLEMGAPFQLEGARANDEQVLLVSQNPGRPGAGVEVRSPDLDVTTTARLSSGSGSMPATGWGTRFTQAAGELNLPPGHRLIAAVGTDRVPGAWLDEWRLWGVFGVLVLAAAARWLAGWRAGLVALVGLTLTYQEAPEYVWLWANLMVAVALARSAPEGRLRRVLRGYRWVSFVVLGVALLPFLFDQVRVALYPQLEGGAFAALNVPGVTLRNEAPESEVAEAYSAKRVDRAKAVNQGAAIAAPAAAPPPAAMQEVVVTGARRQAADEAEGGSAQPYSTGTVIQAGPGIPKWRYRVYRYSWSGAVEPGETVRFLLVGPGMLAVWRIVGAALLVALFLALLRPSSFGDWRSWFGRGDHGGGGGAVAVLILVGLACGPVMSARAASTPDAAILDQLKARLVRAPECSPTCADIASAVVIVRDDQLEVSLTVSALAPLAVPVPAAGDRWRLTSVSVDGKSGVAIAREPDDTRWVPVQPGVHTLLLSGPLATSRDIQLAFPLVPHRVAVTATRGWEVTGLNEEQRLISGSLELVDRRASGTPGSSLTPARDFPVFVSVTRSLDFGVNWSVRTTVERAAPEKGAVSLEIPLLEGESVLGGLKTHTTADGHSVVVVGLEPDEPSTAWSSSLAQGQTLRLSAPAADTRVEVWKFVAAPQWNLVFSGVPAVLPENLGDTWTYEFHPRPGEQLQVSVTRPAATPGASLAVDSVEQVFVPGKRSSDTTLEFTYRSTQGGRHVIQLPESARVTAVELDKGTTPLRPEHGELSLALLPGHHSVRVQWTQPNPVGLISRPEGVDLHSAAGNVRTTIQLGRERWPLFAAGAGVGPAILYWGEIVVFLILAWALGRWRRSPLRFHEWAFLGIGLSTLSWGVLVLVAVWLFALQWRRERPVSATRWKFNLVQIGLALLTVCAVGALVFAGIRQSLLAAPDMAVAGDAFQISPFSWFVDRTSAALPRPAVISAPLWVYRLFMLAWAFWIATALLRWLRTAWEAWKTDGIWRGKNGAAVPAA